MKLLLKEFRKSRGMTQESLAVALETTKRVIGAYERRETPIPLEVAYDITEILGCTLDELCGRKPKRSFSDPSQAALNGYYESMNDGGRTLLVETAESISADPKRRIFKDGCELDRGEEAMGA